MPRSFHPTVLATNKKCRAALLYRSVVSNNMGIRTRASPSRHCSGSFCLSFVLFSEFRPPGFLIRSVLFSDIVRLVF